MPETRKHRVVPRDALDEALFAALGEPVRPTTPGRDADAATPAAGPPSSPSPGPGSPATFVTRASALQGFTIGKAPTTAKTPPTAP